MTMDSDGINLRKMTRLMQECAEELEKAGIKASELVKISLNAHVITDFHKIQDSKDTKIGTTKRGNGPAYRDKYDRKGVRAIEVPQLEPFLVDVYHRQVPNMLIKVHKMPMKV